MIAIEEARSVLQDQASSDEQIQSLLSGLRNLAKILILSLKGEKL